jgi:hypothetical protein
VTLTFDELAADLEFLADAGVGLVEAARRTGYTAAALERRLRRHGRADLFTRMRAMDPAVTPTAVIREDRYAAWARSPEGRAVVSRAARFLEHARATYPDSEAVQAERRVVLAEAVG